MVCDVWPWGWIIVWWVEVVWPLEALVWFLWIVPWDPTFMLGIWNRGDWMKRDLAQPCLWPGGLWKSQTWLAFASLIWGYFSLLIHEYYTSLFVDYMDVVSLVFLLLLWWIWTCIMTVAMYGSHDVLLVNEWTMYLSPNRWNYTYCFEASMLLSNSQISMRPLFPVLLLRPVALMFVTYLINLLSWLVGVQSSPCWCFFKCIFVPLWNLIYEGGIEFWVVTWALGLKKWHKS